VTHAFTLGRKLMEAVDRRSVLGLGLAASTFVLPTAATALASPKAGKELAPGVRQADFGERESPIPGHKRFGCATSIQPGAMTPEREMMNARCAIQPGAN
jgi:hypothetical protein